MKQQGQPKGTTNGSLHWRSRLTEQDVLTIRWLVALGYRPSAIGRRFGVAGGHVSRIAQNRTWRHVDSVVRVNDSIVQVRPPLEYS